MAANTFVFLAFFAILNGSSATPKCMERRSINLLDCSGHHLTSLPRFRQPKIWVESLDWKRNAIVYLNFSSLTIRFPNLHRLDVRENPFDCGSLLPTKFIEVAKRLRAATDSIAPDDNNNRFAVCEDRHDRCDFLLTARNQFHHSSC